MAEEFTDSESENGETVANDKEVVKESRKREHSEDERSEGEEQTEKLPKLWKQKPKIKEKRKKVIKKVRASLKVSAEERDRLERLVLGDASTLLENLGEELGEQDDELFEESTGRTSAWNDPDDEGLVTAREVSQSKKTRRIPLGLKPTSDYQKYLRKKFTDVYGEPSWAKLGRKRPEDDDPSLAILRTSGKMIEKSKYLTKGVIEVKKLASLNSSTRNEGPVVKTVRFHPTAEVALVAGLGCTASVIQVDGTGNSKLASVRFDKFPVRCARFSADGNEFMVGSHLHSHFFVYDMIRGTSMRFATHHNMGQSNFKKFEISPDGSLIAVAGRFGQVNLMTASSKEWISTLSMNGTVEAITFSPDGKLLYSYGDQGDVYVWDISSRRLKHKFHDEGSIRGCSLAVSPCDSYLAVGSASGVVNLYDTPTALSQKDPKPLKAIMNLVTPATVAKFNHSSQLLAISSDEKENAVKMVHLPSMTVYTNFPALNAQLSCIQDVSFSPNSGYLSIANNKSTAFLFRLKHFGNY